MTCNFLPSHPVTGVRALAVLPSGRAVWPILGGDESPQNPVLARSITDRDDQVAFVDRTIETARRESRDLVEAELELIQRAQERVASLDVQIRALSEFESTRSSSELEGARLLAARRAPASDDHDDHDERGADNGRRSLGGGARTEPRTQHRTAGDFIVDLLKSRGFDQTPDDVRDAARARVADATRTRAVANVVTGDVLGVLPTPIVGQIMTDLDAARPFVQSIGAKDLGPIAGKTFSRPTITQHVSVGVQSAEKTELPSQKLVIGDTDFTKATYGGVVDISRQLIDWSSPSAWDAILQDLQDVYAVETEDDAAQAFATAVSQTVQIADPESLEDYITALYAGAAKAITGNGTRRATALRMPDAIWVSVDKWATLGALIDRLRSTTSGQAAGGSSVNSFAGTILNVERIVVPGLAAGTMIIGKRAKTEFYEQRIGLLSAVEPRLLGVEVAYGGYCAFATLDPTAFVKLVSGTDA